MATTGAPMPGTPLRGHVVAVPTLGTPTEPSPTAVAVAGSEPTRARTRLFLLAPVTTHVFNRLTRLVTGWLPGFGTLTHTGRGSGRIYRTPLLVLRSGDDYVIALWYGSDVQWVKNVLAAGGGVLRTHARDIRFTDPRLSVDPARRVLPMPLRWAGALVGLGEFLRLRAA